MTPGNQCGPGSPGFSLPDPSALGRDVTEGREAPLVWSGRADPALLADVEGRLERFGEATVRLDRDAPFPITHEAFVAEMDRLGGQLARPWRHRDGDPPFMLVFIAADSREPGDSP